MSHCKVTMTQIVDIFCSVAIFVLCVQTLQLVQVAVQSNSFVTNSLQCLWVMFVILLGLACLENGILKLPKSFCLIVLSQNELVSHNFILPVSVSSHGS